MQATQYRNPATDTELRNAVCDWLTANNIDPALVPADEKPDCTYRDKPGMNAGSHTITTRVKVQARAGRQVDVIRHGTNRLEHATITMPMRVPPPAIVQTWLDSRCPTCHQ